MTGATSSQAPQFGVVLPHFGSTASSTRILEGAQLAEESGFDALWVRDHLVYQPQAWEDQNATFLDPFITLGAVAAVTSRVALGFSVMAPHRHPVHAALSVASLDLMAGPGRVIAGLGLGDRTELAVVGAARDRRVVFAEYVEILRALWSGRPLTWRGRYFQFDDVAIRPAPPLPVPIWYGAAYNAPGLERVAKWCDGVFLATNRSDFASRRDLLGRAVMGVGRPMPTLAANILVVPHEPSERVEQFVRFESFRRAKSAGAPDAFDGGVIAGTPDAIVRGVRAWLDIGCQHFIFNLRLRHDKFESLIATIGADVLQSLRGLTDRPSMAAPGFPGGSTQSDA